ncbi:MAG: hypothetical protein MJZ24_09140 [Paludibacteraceae bacterium]|nr:hypothetical protein [Paludibacteraceae bacterium]
MGFLKTLGDVAKGFAEGYIEERGIQGTLEDVSDVAKKVFGNNTNNISSQDLLSALNNKDSIRVGIFDIDGNDRVGIYDIDGNDTEYKQRWDTMIDKICRSMDEGNFAKAEQQLKSYYNQYEDDKDYYFYYYNSCIMVRWLEYGADKNIAPKICQQAQNHIKNALRLADNDESRENMLELQDRLETQIERQKNNDIWDAFVDQLSDQLDNNEYENAKRLLDYHYDHNENSKDYYYYYFLSCIYVRWIEHGVPEEQASHYEQMAEDTLNQANRLSDSDNDKENISDLHERLNKQIQDRLSREQYFNDFDSLASEINVLAENKMYKEAIDKIDEFYQLHNDDFDNWYYDNKTYYTCLWYKSLPWNATNDTQLERDIIILFSKWSGVAQADGQEAIDDYLFGKEQFEIIKLDRAVEKLTAYENPSPNFEEALQLLETFHDNHQSLNDHYWDIRRLIHLRWWRHTDIINPKSKTLEKLTEEDFEHWKEYCTEPDQIEKFNTCIGYFEKFKAEREQEQKDKRQSIGFIINSNTSEQEYLEEYKACLDDDGTISDKERRLLDRLAKSLGIDAQRAKELEDTANRNNLTLDENEYLNEYQACLSDDGSISDKERRLLNKLHDTLGISEQRATEIEAKCRN